MKRVTVPCLLCLLCLLVAGSPVQAQSSTTTRPAVGGAGTTTPLVPRTVIATDDAVSIALVKIAAAIDTATANKLKAMLTDAAGTALPIARETAFAWSSIDLDETEEQVDADTGCLTGMVVSNLSAATVFIKVYNLPIGSVTVGTTVPWFPIPVATGGPYDVTGAFIVGGNACLAYNSLSIAATTDLVEDGSPGAPGPNEVVVTVFYKD